MIIDEFMEGIKFFNAKHGKKITVEQAESLFNYEWKNRKYDLFMQAIKNISVSDGKKPEMFDIEKEYNVLLPGKNKAESQDCPRCGGLGFIYYIQMNRINGEEVTTVARCTCPQGKQLSKEIPSCEDIAPAEEGMRSDDVRLIGK